MCGTATSVSTLLIVVGCANTPLTAGKGGLMRGLPRRPSMEFIRAVSSPQMYAPAQPGILDRGDDIGRRHRERLLQRGVSTALLPSIERGRFRISEILREQDRLTLVRFVRISH